MALSSPAPAFLPRSLILPASSRPHRKARGKSKVRNISPAVLNPPQPHTGLRKALLAIEWGSERSGSNWDVKVDTFSALTGEKNGAMVHSLRSLGSAALNMCGVAAGELDGYWEGGCWPWDVAAGWVVVSEAEGLVVGENRGEWEPKVDGRRSLIVRAGERGREFVEEFWARVVGQLEY